MPFTSLEHMGAWRNRTTRACRLQGICLVFEKTSLPFLPPKTVLSFLCPPKRIIISTPLLCQEENCFFPPRRQKHISWLSLGDKMQKFEFTFLKNMLLKYLGSVPEFCAVSSFPNEFIYFSCWLELEFDFSQSCFYPLLETFRGRTLMSRWWAAWKRSMDRLANQQSPRRSLEEGNSGEHVSVIFLHFSSWCSPDRASPWESSGERAPSTCS